MTNDSKHIQASILPILTDWLRLQVAQMARCRDLAIFMVMTTDGQTDRPITLPLHAHEFSCYMIVC